MAIVEAGDREKVCVVSTYTGSRCEGMSRCHGNMITAGNTVACLSKAGRRQEFFGGEVGKLYDFSRRISIDIIFLDNGKQTGACPLYRIHWISRAPILMECRNWSCLEIECEQLSEFLDAKRAGSHCNELKQPTGEFPVCLVDPSQGALICFVQRLWQVS
jgi:hypothetical protein